MGNSVVTLNQRQHFRVEENRVERQKHLQNHCSHLTHSEFRWILPKLVAKITVRLLWVTTITEVEVHKSNHSNHVNLFDKRNIFIVNYSHNKIVHVNKLSQRVSLCCVCAIGISGALHISLKNNIIESVHRQYLVVEIVTASRAHTKRCPRRITAFNFPYRTPLYINRVINQP